jgi:hypothetical protein
MGTVQRFTVGDAFQGQTTNVIGLYADFQGASAILVRITNEFQEIKRGMVKSDLYAEILKYRGIKGITLNRKEISFSAICNAIEILVAECEEGAKLYCNKMTPLENMLIKQSYPLKIEPVEFDIEQMLLTINCLINDDLLQFSKTGENSLRVQYDRELKNYSDPSVINHRIYALGLALNDFVPGSAEWISGLNSLELGSSIDNA